MDLISGNFYEFVLPTMGCPIFTILHRGGFVSYYRMSAIRLDLIRTILFMYSSICYSNKSFHLADMIIR